MPTSNPDDYGDYYTTGPADQAASVPAGSATADGTLGEQSARSYLDQYLQGAVDSGAITQDWANGISPRADSVAASMEASRAAASDPTKTADSRTPAQEPSLLDKIMKWGMDNKGNPILGAALAGVAAMGKNDFSREQAATAQQYALQRADHDAQIARDKIAANSASVSGIPAAKGIIAQRLSRLNGAPVFGPTGRVL